MSQGRELRAAAVQFGKFRTGIECVGACVGEARVEALFLEPEPDLLGERHESVPLFTPRFARRRRAFRGKNERHARHVETQLTNLQPAVLNPRVTGLVAHWWEYFHAGVKNESFVRARHGLAAWRAEQDDVRVVPFSAWAEEKIPLS